MFRPLSDAPATRVVVRRSRRRRALTYDDLPPEMKEAIQDYLRFTNASVRAAVADYFRDKAATERWYGKIGTWDVGRVTDMSRLFKSRYEFNEARARRRKKTCYLLDARRGVSIPDCGSLRALKHGNRRTSARGTRRR